MVGLDAYTQSGLPTSDSTRTITEIRLEKKVVAVYNLEVANAHTFFVGEDGVVVHNGRNCSIWFPSQKKAKDASTKKGGDGKPHGPDAYGKEGHYHDRNHDDKTKTNFHYRWGGRRK